MSNYWNKYHQSFGAISQKEAITLFWADVVTSGAQTGGIKGRLIQSLGWFGGVLSVLAAPDIDEISRRDSLKYFAQKQFLENNNRCNILTQLLDYSAELVTNSKNPAKTMITDLQLVLVGENLRSRRGRGRFFAGNIRGSEGFKSFFRDDFNQIQHAAAGIIISQKYGWLGYQFAKTREQEPQDDLLYDATYSLGKSLSDDNYYSLANHYHKAICD